MKARSDVDPITSEVIRYELVAAAEEMRKVFRRSTMSMTLYELNDFGMSIFDDEFNMLADAPGLCLFTGSLGEVTRSCVHQVGLKDLHPGDVIVTTIPFDLGSQTADAAVVTPIFYKNQIVGYASLKAHFGDLGGIDPYPTSSTDMYQEGLLLPALKIIRRGRVNDELVRLIQANSRLPISTIGNFLAGTSAIKTAAARVQEIVQRHSLNVFRRSVKRILDHGERLSRKAIEAMPDGTWTVEDYMDNNGVEREPVRISMTVTVKGSELLVDLSGSAPTQNGPVNCPLPGAISACRYAIKAITVPKAPPNEGHFRPLTVKAAPNTLFHPLPPAPTFLGSFCALRLVDLLPLALAEAVPDKAIASSGSDVSAVIMFFLNPKNKLPETVGGAEPIGMGALRHADGQNVLVHHSEAGCQSIPIEVIESRAPMLVERFELRQDSGGPGRYRGGLGARKIYHALEDCVAIAVLERVTGPSPRGLDGAEPGRSGFLVVYPGTSREWRGGRSKHYMTPGDRVIHETHGGGGFGPAHERSAKAVLDDVLNGYVSESAAQRDYGVVIRSGEIDRDATSKLRATAGRGVARGELQLESTASS